MTLQPGTHLGPYEIVALLGAGGMGEVYRARDPRLSREVAVKVLTSSLSADADRLRRFEQEARAAGLLNHPNLTAVYDIGSDDGTPYVVSELLEGETLRARLGAGAVPVRKALDYAVQLARGLAAAHEKKIVHRDLKPENIFLTRDGRVKILDFGLAKLKESEREGGEHTALPTATRGTEPGLVMGTMGYMSPEQVRGLPADHRSDIFSFGAILHEMLSGQRAFRGDTAADSITAILTKDPPDLTQTNREIHPGLERIVRHCLEKNREERFESARDLAFDLEALSGLSTPSTPVAAAAHGVRRLRWVPVAAALAVGIAIGAAGGLFAGKRAYERHPPSFRQLTFRRGQIQSARFAPDGQTILYTAAWEGQPMEIFVSRLDSPESRPFGLRGAQVMSISPSGEMAVSLNRQNVGAFTGEGTLGRIGITGGGSPREMLEDVQWADWAPDGKVAVVREVGDKNQLEYPVGKVLYSAVGWLSHPRVSRSGDEVAVVEHPVRGDDGGSIVLFDRSGNRKEISEHFASVQGIAWSAAGDEVWFTAARVGFNRYVHAVSRAGKLRGLAEGTGGLTIEDVSRDGKVLLSQEKARQSLFGKGPSAEQEIDLAWLDWSLPTGISDDGSTFLFDESGEGGGPGYSVYVRKTDGSPPVRLGEGSAQDLSPDGKRVLAIVKASTNPRLVVYPTGAGEPTFLDTPGLAVRAAAWHPDGKQILLAATEADRGVRLYLQSPEGGRPRAFTPEGYRPVGSAISPDGKFVLTNGPDRRRYLYPISGGEPTPVVGLEENVAVAGWTSSPDVVYARRRNELPAQVYRLNLRTGEKEPWRALMPADSAGVTGIGGTNITPDGKAYVYSFLRSLADLYLVEGLK